MLQEHRAVASIIASPLRCMDNFTNQARINNLTDGTDLFVCTDKSYAKFFPNMTRMVAHSFSEDDPSWKTQINLTKQLQWWRLQKCWQMVQEYEGAQGFKYEFFFKLRTDCFRKGGCVAAVPAYQQILKDHGPDLDGMAFARSDMTFGGTRPSFSRVATLFSRIGTDYWDRLHVFWPLDYDLILRSDGAFNRYAWLVHPRAVMKPQRCCTQDDLREKKEELKAFVAAGHVVDGPTCTTAGECSGGPPGKYQGITTYERHPRATSFCSEQAFLLDLLRVGFEVHGLQKGESPKHSVY